MFIVSYNRKKITLKYSWISPIIWPCYLWWGSPDPDPLWKRILIHISGGLDFILIFMKHFFFVLKISKTFVLFRRTSSEYLTRYGQRSVFKDPFLRSVLKTDPSQYFLNVHLTLWKREQKFEIFNTDKKCFIKINIESSPLEI